MVVLALAADFPQGLLVPVNGDNSPMVTNDDHGSSKTSQAILAAISDRNVALAQEDKRHTRAVNMGSVGEHIIQRSIAQMALTLTLDCVAGKLGTETVAL
ncbi:MAG: hypothetical protein R2853_05355 [Thermomicrobiales bacterium]